MAVEQAARTMGRHRARQVRTAIVALAQEYREACRQHSVGDEAPSSVRHYVRDGRLPAIRHGRDWLIKAADLERLERRAYRRGAGEGQAEPSLSTPARTLESKEERP